MTGVLNAMVGQGGGQRFTVTIGNASDNYGYNDASFGSISPSSYRGASVRVVSCDLSDDALTVTMAGSLAQSFFSGIELQRTDGGITTLFTSAATFNDFTTVTSWQWSTTTDVYTSTTPGTRLIRIF